MILATKERRLKNRKMSAKIVSGPGISPQSLRRTLYLNHQFSYKLYHHILFKPNPKIEGSFQRGNIGLNVILHVSQKQNRDGGRNFILALANIRLILPNSSVNQ
jgi:hypothetical protein